MHVGVAVKTMDKTQGGGGTITFHSLNVRGLRDKSKQNKMFNFLKSNYPGILYLQEVHITDLDDKQNWYNTWGEHVYFSYGNAHSKGTVTIIPKHIKCEITETIIDPNGRYVLLDGKFDGQEISLLNFYGPTQEKLKEQSEYIDILTPMILTRAHKLIWAGDMNVYLDPLLDRHNPNTDKPTETVKRILLLLEEVNMCDLWRVMNPEEKRYTWRKSTYKGCVQSRLDYWLTPNSYFYKVKECKINPSILSDHSVITLKINNDEKIEKGKGMWKLNVTLLNDPVYIKRINELIEELIEKYKDIKDPRLKWDVIKMDVRGSTISYASYKAKMKREHEVELLKQMKDLEPKINKDPEENDMMLYASLAKELEQLNNEITRGIQLRAQCEHMELNETNSAYFLSKEKSQAEIKSITKLVLENGNEITDIKEILAEQKRFYGKLYAEPNAYSDKEIQESDNFFVENNPNVPRVTEEDKDLLDRPLTYEEIAKAIKDLPNNKSPGSDGFQINFYKAFWPKIKTLVCDSISAAISEKKMSIEQRRGILSLIPKKDKDIRELKNWRPISLLNSDYKIFAKAMATRLQTVLPYIINTDQSGCIKGRSAHNNILSTIDIIKHVNNNKLPGLLAFIDYEKAFDSIKWSFMFKCLEELNFGKYFTECI